MTWNRVRLKDVGTWYGGGTPSKSNPAFWTDGDVPWLSPKDMGPEVLTSTIDHVTDAAVTGSSTKLVPAGAVAIVTRSGILQRTIPVALVPFATTMNQDMKAVLPREGIDPRWIAWGLRAYERELLRETRKAGTTVASIEMSRFYGFEVPVPELNEQRRIIALLESHLSRLMDAERSLAAAQSRLDALQRASVTRLVLPDSARFLLRQDPSLLGADEPPPAPLPAGWRWARWSEVGTSENGKLFPSSEYQQIGIRLLRPGNLGPDGRLCWPAANTKRLPDSYRGSHERSLLREGDLVMNLTAQSLKDDFLGRVCVVGTGDEALLNQRIARLRGVGIESAHALLVFRSGLFRHYVKSLSTGSLIQHMFTKQIDRFWVPLPPRGWQIEASAAAERDELVWSRQHRAIKSQRQRSISLRRSLLAAAFSGRLVGSVGDGSESRKTMSA